MPKLKIESSPAEITQRCTTQITTADLLAAFRLPLDADVTLVTANGAVGLADEDVLAVAFMKRTTSKPRVKKAAE